MKSSGTFRHHSGVEYELLCVTNTTAKDNTKWPVTAVYRNKDGELFSRPASEFFDKFKEV